MSKKPGARSQEPEGEARRELRRRCLLLAPGFWLLASLPSPLLADPTQEDVLRSIGQNVSEPVDANGALAILAGVAGGLILLVVVGQRRARVTKPKSLNHHGKLMKEVLRTVPLKPAELKQLNLLLHESRSRGGEAPAESPLTLVLCPSVMLKAAQARPEKIDRKVVAGIARKAGAG